jgi:hypothetical protein
VDTTFAFIRIRGSGWDWQTIHKEAQAALDPARVWGVFEGLFGVRSNELVVVTHGSDTAVDASIETLGGLPAVTAIESSTFVPTVRPKTTAPMTRAGLYVFRFFEVGPDDVEEAVALSDAAWTTFENNDGYETEPMGLFSARHPTGDMTAMLLVTWYDGLNSWQESRASDPAAVANFKKRRALTDGAMPYATRLLTI